MRAYINLFGKTIHLYGILSFIGLALAVALVIILAKKEKFEFFDFTLVIIVTLVSALVGAKLLFVIVSWNTIVDIFKQYPFIDALMSIIQGGFVFYGGLLGGGLGLFIFTKCRKESMFKYTNLFTMALPLGHAFGRVGCFIAGCCYGMPYDGFLSYTYNYQTFDASTPIGIPLLPVQLIEAAALLLLFTVLIVIYFKAPAKKNWITGIYMVAYAVLRFILEFFRGDKERGLFLGLSTSQWISIAIVVVVAVLVTISILKKKKQPQQKTEA